MGIKQLCQSGKEMSGMGVAARIASAVTVFLFTVPMLAAWEQTAQEELQFEIISHPSGATVFVNHEENITMRETKLVVDNLKFQKIGTTPLTWKFKTKIPAYEFGMQPAGEYGDLPLRYFAFRIAKSGYLEKEAILEIYTLHTTAEPGNVYYMIDKVAQGEEKMKRKKRYRVFTNLRWKQAGIKPKPIHLKVKLEGPFSEIGGFQVTDYELKDRKKISVKRGEKVDLLVKLDNANSSGWFAYIVDSKKSYVAGFDPGFVLYNAVAELELNEKETPHPQYIQLLQAKDELGHTFFPGEIKTAHFRLEFSKDIPQNFSAVFTIRLFAKKGPEDKTLNEVRTSNNTIAIEVTSAS